MLPNTHRYQNHLLLGLPEELQGQLARYLEWLPLLAGQVLCVPDVPVRYAFFPADCIVSLMCATEDGDTAEVAAVGSEGMLDVSVYLGGDNPVHCAVVRNSGFAYRCPAHLLKGEFSGSAALQRLLLRYSQSLLTQIAQTAVCNRYHSVSQQLCRWLLVNLERTRSHEFAITQEAIANILGVRREGVTEAAGKLRAQGFIDYHRGTVTVLDPAGLREAACDCHAVFIRALPRYLPTQHATTRAVHPLLQLTRPLHTAPASV